MTVTDRVQGAWTRRAVSVGDGPHFETQLVVWLQAGDRYADVRVPLHPAADERCFTGRSFWEGDRYRWTHVLDIETVAGVVSPAADDVGAFVWDGPSLIERGMFPTVGGPLRYEEIWERLPAGDGPSSAFEAPGACLVRVGDHAITVVDDRAEGGAFSACYRVRDHGVRNGGATDGDATDGDATDGDVWRTVASIGEDATALPDPDSVPAHWHEVVTLDTATTAAGQP
ncbi:MAG: hypothetical protein NVS3B12_29300 [Acidimicrobiales bacterium]